MTLLQTIHARLEEAAYKVTDNFCYGCYQVVEGAYCPDCHSDDFMRHLDGVGVEYGTEWVIDHIIQDRCEAIDGEALFAEMLDECSPKIALGIGANEHINSLVNDCQLYESGGGYYLVSAIEEMLDEIE